MQNYLIINFFLFDYETDNLYTSYRGELLITQTREQSAKIRLK